MNKAKILFVAVKLLELTKLKTLTVADIESAMRILYPINNLTMIRHCNKILYDVYNNKCDMTEINDYKKELKRIIPNIRFTIGAVAYLYGVIEEHHEIPDAISITHHIIRASLLISFHLRKSTYDIKYIVYALRILEIPKNTEFETVTREMIEICNAEQYISPQIIIKINEVLINYKYL